MDPATYLESRGWNNDNRRFAARKVGPLWKLTYRDNGPIGDYTRHYLLDTLAPAYSYVRHTTRNKPIPRFILCPNYDDPDFVVPNRGVSDHTLTLWLKESIHGSD